MSHRYTWPVSVVEVIKCNDESEGLQLCDRLYVQKEKSCFTLEGKKILETKSKNTLSSLGVNWTIASR